MWKHIEIDLTGTHQIFFLWCLWIFLMLWHQYEMLSIDRYKTCALKQLTFVFAPWFLVRQVIFADLGQA